MVCFSDPVTIHILTLAGWGLPFFWARIWGIATVPYVRWAMAKETEAWEKDQVLDPENKLADIESAPPSEPEQTTAAVDVPSAPIAQSNPEQSTAVSTNAKDDTSPGPPMNSTEAPLPETTAASAPDASSPRSADEIV